MLKSVRSLSAGRNAVLAVRQARHAPGSFPSIFCIQAPMTTTPPDTAQDTTPSLAEVAEIIVTALNLEMSPSEIEPDASLFGDGLGLDSIDILEIALVISKRYGIQLRADSEDNTSIFRSLRSLTNHIAGQKTA